MTASAAAAISNHGSVKGYSTKLAECGQAVKDLLPVYDPSQVGIDYEVETKNCRCSLADFMDLVQKVIKL